MLRNQSESRRELLHERLLECPTAAWLFSKNVQARSHRQYQPQTSSLISIHVDSFALLWQKSCQIFTTKSCSTRKRLQNALPAHNRGTNRMTGKWKAICPSGAPTIKQFYRILLLCADWKRSSAIFSEPSALSTVSGPLQGKTWFDGAQSCMLLRTSCMVENMPKGLHPLAWARDVRFFYTILGDHQQGSL